MSESIGALSPLGALSSGMPAVNADAMKLYEKKFSYLAPSLREPDFLRSLIDRYRSNAVSAKDGSQLADWTRRMTAAKGALKDIYGIDYDSPFVK